MPKYGNYYIDQMRDAIIEELEEWIMGIGTHHQKPPVYLWFVFEDAGIPISDVALIVEAEPDAETEDIATTLVEQAREQMLNASREQVKCYLKAREAWVETP